MARCRDGDAAVTHVARLAIHALVACRDDDDDAGVDCAFDGLHEWIRRGWFVDRMAKRQVDDRDLQPFFVGDCELDRIDDGARVTRAVAVQHLHPDQFRIVRDAAVRGVGFVIFVLDDPGDMSAMPVIVGTV